MAALAAVLVYATATGRPLVAREPVDTGPPPPRLLDRIRQAVRARHYSRHTEKAYVARARRHVLFHGKRHAFEMGAAEVTQYLNSLAARRHVSGSTQNQALGALVFLYRQVLGDGRDIRTVQALLGHRDVGATQIYMQRAEARARGGSKAGRRDGPMTAASCRLARCVSWNCVTGQRPSDRDIQVRAAQARLHVAPGPLTRLSRVKPLGPPCYAVQDTYSWAPKGCACGGCKVGALRRQSEYPGDRRISLGGLHFLLTWPVPSFNRRH